MIDVLHLDREFTDCFLGSILEDSLILLDSTLFKSLSEFSKYVFTSLFKSIFDYDSVVYTSVFKSIFDYDSDDLVSLSGFKLYSPFDICSDLLVLLLRDLLLVLFYADSLLISVRYCLRVEAYINIPCSERIPDKS